MSEEEVRQSEIHTLEVRAPWEAFLGASEGGEIIKRKYADLLQREKRYPDPHDKYTIAMGIKADSPEWQRLQDAGVVDATTAKSEFTREELLRAGFFFVNSIGGGEKSLISGDFPDPDDPSQILNFETRRLLTREELDKVYRYQSANPATYGLHGVSVDDVRQDILLFLEAATCVPVFGSWNDVQSECTPFEPDSVKWLIGTQKEREKAKKFLTWKARNYADNCRASGQFVPGDKTLLAAAFEEFMQDEDLEDEARDMIVVQDRGDAGMVRTTRGHNTAVRGSVREDKLNNKPSPFLDRGYLFDENLDVLVETVVDGETRLQRINNVMLQMVGGHPDYPGLGQMGKQDWDQEYMSSGYYASELYPSEPMSMSTWKHDLMRIDASNRDKFRMKIQERLIAVAGQEEIPDNVEPLNFDPPRLYHREMKPPWGDGRDEW